MPFYSRTAFPSKEENITEMCIAKDMPVLVVTPLVICGALKRAEQNIVWLTGGVLAAGHGRLREVSQFARVSE
jgi:hypothetical protein